jgi:hypothetical protein
MVNHLEPVVYRGIGLFTGCSLGQLIKIIREPQLESVIEKLIDFSAGKDDELRDISGLGSPCYFNGSS